MVQVAVSAFVSRYLPRSAVPRLLAYSAALVAVLLLLPWLGTSPAVPPFRVRLAVSDIIAMHLIGLGLLVVAPAQIAAQIALERRGGTLEQLRTTPVPPIGLVVGLMVGPPARLLVVLVGPFALHVLVSVLGIVPLSVLAGSTVVLVAGAIGAATIGLCAALAPRQDGGSGLLALGVAGALLFSAFVASVLVMEGGGSVSWGILHPVGALQALYLGFNGPWRNDMIGAYRLERFLLPAVQSSMALAPLVSAAAATLGSVLLLRAACRRIARPLAPFLSKPLALALFGLTLMLTLTGDLLSSNHTDLDPLLFSMHGLLMPVAALFGLMATPSPEQWSFRQRTRARVRWFADDAAPHVTMWLMALLTNAACLLLWHSLGSGNHPDRFMMTLFVGLDWPWVTLPIYVLFASTRYTSTAARIAFAVAIGCFLLVRGSLLAVLLASGGPPGEAVLFMRVSSFMAYAVPAWVFYRQYALNKRLRGTGPAAYSVGFSA
jgi:hypothetical protein